MDIQLTSFILGMSLVLVIAMAAVSVYAIVKVVKLKNDHNSFCMWSSQEFDKLRKENETKDTELEHKIGIVYRDIDSRLDKLYEKIMKNKNPRAEVFEMADKPGFKETLRSILNKEEEGNELKNRILELMNKESKDLSIIK